MADERRWGFVSYRGVFVAKAVPMSVVEIERPEGWTDKEWDEFVLGVTEDMEESHEPDRSH